MQSLTPFATLMAAEIATHSASNSDHHYAIKRPTIRMLQQSGLRDAEIEEILDISIHPEDKNTV